MSFRPRNAYYLRISADLVLPLYVGARLILVVRTPTDFLTRQLYLDERHIGWMSDLVLQHVLADLRPLSVYI
jgi:hypothetical protein